MKFKYTIMKIKCENVMGEKLPPNYSFEMSWPFWSTQKRAHSIELPNGYIECVASVYIKISIGCAPIGLCYKCNSKKYINTCDNLLHIMCEHKYSAFNSRRLLCISHFVCVFRKHENLIIHLIGHNVVTHNLSD